MKNKIAIVTGSAMALTAFGTHAATIRNVDTEPRAVVITEGGVRNEQSIAANATITACASGCFVTFPDGEMLPLSGSENVVIEKGKARILSK